MAIKVMVSFFNIVAYLLAIVASVGCKYVTVDLTQGSELFYEYDNFGFGLYWQESPDGFCTEWGEEEKQYFFDASWKAARAMATLANITGFIGTIITLGMMCMSMPPGFIKFGALLLFVTGIFEVFTFVAFSSDICDKYGCTFGICAGLAIAASGMFFITSFIVYKIPSCTANDELNAGSTDPHPVSVSVSP